MDIVIDALPTFLVGLVVGIAAMALFNKVRSGAANPAKAKKEFEEYQEQVEAHFEETSRKFQSMATQYQELYEHLAVGAVSLCRTERAVKLLDKADADKKDAKPLENRPDKKIDGQKNSRADSRSTTGAAKNDVNSST